MKALVILVLVGASARVAAADDSWRCPNGIVKLGDKLEDVQAACGAPTKSEHKVQQYTRHGLTGAITIDTWTYDRGPNDLIRVLWFQNGLLHAIELGGYGKAGGG
jgi:hypothetical protein